MCTIGALLLGEDEAVVFKNKDFARTTFDDQVVLTADLFGVRGLETFASSGGTDVYSGIPVGANAAGLMGADADVLVTGPEAHNYDELLATVLSVAGNVTEAIEVVSGAVAATPYWRGNLVVADGTAVAAIEVHDKQARAVFGGDRIARTNHHLEFAASAGESPTSRDRLSSVSDRLAAASGVDDIIDMLSSHDAATSGICSHAASTTVYSYVLHRRGATTTLYVTQGPPCRSRPQRLELPLGKAWNPGDASAFLRAYPTGAAQSPTAGQWT